MVPVAIGLGSNLGDPVRHLLAAAKELEKKFGATRLSPLFRTSPMYVEDQPPYINAVALFETDLAPRALLRILKEMEQQLGREQGIRFGPRVIDLDLLTYGALRYRHTFGDAKTLHIPHPRMTERLFVLVPLIELDPSWKIPGYGVARDFADNDFEGQWIESVTAPNELAPTTVRMEETPDADF